MSTKREKDTVPREDSPLESIEVIPRSGTTALDVWRRLRDLLTSAWKKEGPQVDAITKEVNSRLQKQTVENELKKEEIESLRVNTLATCDDQRRAESFFELDKRQKELSLEKAAVDVEIAKETLLRMKQERLLELIETSKSIGLDVTTLVDENGKPLLYLDSIPLSSVEKTSDQE